MNEFAGNRSGGVCPNTRRPGAVCGTARDAGRSGRCSSMAGMTLVEVMVATAIFGLIFGSVLTGLWQASYRTTWTTLSVEAARFAEERIEQTQNARWDPTALPVVDEVVSTNFPLRTGALFEFSSGGSVLATNTLTITTLTNTYGGTYRAIASTVVWKYRGRGPFTNNVVTIRAQD